MRTDVIYTFPITISKEKYHGSSFLERGNDDQVGLIWLEMNMQTSHSQLAFFQINPLASKVSQQSVNWPVFSNTIRLHYDLESHTWIVCLRTHKRVGKVKADMGVYEIHVGQKSWLVPLIQIDTGLLGNQVSSLMLINKRGKLYNLLYFADNIDEVSDSKVYWVTWRNGLLPTTDIPPLFITYCDTALGYSTDERYLIFLCKHQEPPKDELRRGSGGWQLGLEVYDSERKLVGQENLTTQSIRIRDMRMPSNDLLAWLKVRMVATTGPRRGSPLEKSTCVAALVLYEPAELPREEPDDELDELMQYPPHRHARYVDQGGQQQGGLFCFDSQGTCLLRGTSVIGTQISMCCCGERIIGADRLPDRRRLWTWLPLQTQEIQECLLLDSAVKRATVVSQDGEHKSDDLCFWLVEEYEDRVKVSLRESTSCTERTMTWLEGIVLLDGPYDRYLNDQQKPAGVLPYHDTLLLLGFDMQKQLTLFQVSI